MTRPLEIADLFCGAGGTSTGAAQAAESLGRAVRITAVNHWPVAVETHSANHPSARHLCASLDSLNPRDLYRPGQLDILWASPECTHHSLARGGMPINDQSRATAWCVTRWAEALRPAVILVENVPEFVTWGPIGSNGRPLASRKGEIFRSWVRTLEAIGYRVDWRILCAADYGDPTTRRRLFIQAVRGRRSITWPDPTHSASGEAELFRGKAPWRGAREIIDWSLAGESIYERQRPLSPKTMARIEAGLRKFGVQPFIVPQHSNPTPKLTSEPVPTLCAEGSGPKLIQPFLVQLRGTSITQCASSAKGIDQPVGTLTAGGGHHGLVEPFLINTAHAGPGRRPLGVNEPVPTVAGNRGDLALCEPFLLPQQSGGQLRPVSQPAPTISTAGAIALTEPFLVKYYGTGGANSVDEPLDTVTTKDRHALVRPQVVVDGETFSLDIRFRMLQPHELAAAQGFPKDYKFSGTKTEQVKQMGNAVCPGVARALVRAVLQATN